MSKVTVKLEGDTELVIETEFGFIELRQHMTEASPGNFRTVLDIKPTGMMMQLSAQRPIVRFSDNGLESERGY